MTKLLDIRNRLNVSLMTAMATVLATGEASAQSSVGTIANTAGTSLQGMGDLLLGGAFLGGLGFVGAGLLKMKKAADSDGRDPYGPGIWRLGVGGALVALPVLTNAMQGTLFSSKTGVTAPIGVRITG